LQQIYAALPDGPLQARIALIADSLGGGFNGQSMGRDIEGRLEDPLTRRQAVTDAQIALALGAILSDSVATILADQSFVTDKAHLISALTEVGLPQFAGPIAAELYFEGLKAAL